MTRMRSVNSLRKRLESTTNETGREPNHTEIPTTLTEDIESFHTANGMTYADIQVNSRKKLGVFDREVFLIGSIEGSIGKLIKRVYIVE